MNVADLVLPSRMMTGIGLGYQLLQTMGVLRLP